MPYLVRLIMRSVRILVAQLVALTLSCFVQAQKYEKDNLPRLPGAELLVEDYLPERYLLTTADKTITLQEDEVGLSGRPSISTDGSIVASVHRAPGDLSRAPRTILSTYSVQDGKLTEHWEIQCTEGSVAISPDGSKLACNASRTQIRILDLKAGTVSSVQPSLQILGGDISWSPDSFRIVFDRIAPGQRFNEIYSIYTFDIRTGKISEIGLGRSPSWSPSGEWIAYVGYIEGSDRQQESNFYRGRYYAINDFQVSLMSQTGLHSRALWGFSSDVVPSLEPVWSPDSKELLLARSRDPDNGTFDISLVNVASGRTRKKFKNVAPVYAWIEAK
jgi:hypothetical protein